MSMSRFVVSGRTEQTSGRLTVPVGAFEHAGFETGEKVFARALNKSVKLSRARGKADAALSVDVDGRIKLSPTILSQAGLRKRNFSIVSNGNTLTVS